MFEPANPLPVFDMIIGQDIEIVYPWKNRKLSLIRFTKKQGTNFTRSKKQVSPKRKHSNINDNSLPIKFPRNYDDKKWGTNIYQCYLPTTIKEIKAFNHFKLTYRDIIPNCLPSTAPSDMYSGY